MNSSYELVLMVILSGPGLGPWGPAHMDTEGVKIVQALPDDFHAHVSRRCKDLGLYNPAEEISPADLRAGGDEAERLADVGFLNIMRGRYQGRKVPGDPGLPPQPGK